MEICEHGLRQFPGHAENKRTLQRKDMQLEFGSDAKTATAATPAGPVEIGLRSRIRNANLRLAVDHGDLLQAVAGKTMRARQQSVA